MLAQKQGANVTQIQKQVAAAGTMQAAVQAQNVTAYQVQVASRGATKGVLVQNQVASVT